MIRIERTTSEVIELEPGEPRTVADHIAAALVKLADVDATITLKPGNDILATTYRLLP